MPFKGKDMALRYCPKACFVSEHSAALLVGDALHSLPPDIGQGVNSALEDILHHHMTIISL